MGILQVYSSIVGRQVKTYQQAFSQTINNVNDVRRLMSIVEKSSLRKAEKEARLEDIRRRAINLFSDSKAIPKTLISRTESKLKRRYQYVFDVIIREGETQNTTTKTMSILNDKQLTKAQADTLLKDYYNERQTGNYQKGNDLLKVKLKAVRVASWLMN